MEVNWHIELQFAEKLKVDFVMVRDSVEKAQNNILWLPESVLWMEFHELMKDINFVVSEKQG